MAAMDASEVARGIGQYRSLVATKLQPHLDRLFEKRHDVVTQEAQYKQLAEQLTTMRSAALKEVETLLNLGASHFVNAKVPDASKVFVNIGLGFHLEMTVPEALEFCDKKTTQLKSTIATLSAQIADAKADLGIANYSLKQLEAMQ